MKKKIHIKMVLSLFLTLPLWIGCSNGADEVEAISPTTNDYSGEPIRVVTSAIGSANFDGGTVTRSGSMKELSIQPLDESFDTGYDIETTIEAIGQTLTRAKESLPNVHYRIVAYRNNTIASGNYAGFGDFSTDAAGIATSIAGKELFLPAGPYKFMCYTFGDENLPEFDINATSVPVSHNQNFMTKILDNVNVQPDPVTGIFKLGELTFNCLCAQLQLEVSADGFYDNTITACAATVNNMNDNTVSWNYGDATLPSTGTSGSVGFTWPTVGDMLASSEQKIVLPCNEREIAIAFTDLQVGDVTINNAVVKVPGKFFVAAGNYKIAMHITRNYIEVGNAKWAKGNVYKEGDSFKIEASQEAYHTGKDNGSYFGWNTTELGDGLYNNGIYNYEEDPCSKIKPAGTWILPTRNQAEALVPTFYWNADTKCAEFGDGTVKLILPATGVRINATGTSPQGVSNEGKSSSYMLSDNTPPRYYQSFSLQPTSARFVTNMIRSHGAPIRCVKKEAN